MPLLPLDRWTETSQGVHERRLGKLELCFALDGIPYGTAQSYASVRIEGPANALTVDDLRHAWTRTRRRNPLLAARVSISAGRTGGTFRVSEEDMDDPNALEVLACNADECASRLMRPGEPQMQCHQRLSKLFVVPSPGSSSSTRSAWTVFEYVDHCIGDMHAHCATLRTFVEELAGRSDPLPDLRTALARVPSLEAYLPHKKLSPALQRWRRATTQIILQIRAERQQGGKTLPKRTLRAPDAVPVSLLVSRRLDSATTAKMATTVARSRHAFSSHHSIFGQIATLRTLYRLRAEGHWSPSPSEWEAILQQPFHCTGPINLRPAIGYDRHAQACCISFASAVFPSLRPQTTSATVPSYDDLCSRERYLGRVRSATAQIRGRFEHPLFADISDLFAEGFLSTRPAYGGSRPTVVPSSGSAAGTPVQSCFGGSSAGRIDRLLPVHYDRDIALSNFRVQLRVRPGELYLGSQSWGGEERFVAYVDEATFDRRVIEMWMDEVVAAAKHYLIGDGELQAKL